MHMNEGEACAYLVDRIKIRLGRHLQAAANEVTRFLAWRSRDISFSVKHLKHGY